MEPDVKTATEAISDSLTAQDIDPTYHDRMLEIETRAKAREEKLIGEAEKMSQDLNFEDMT